jgi:hypothetical protein
MRHSGLPPLDKRPHYLPDHQARALASLCPSCLVCSAPSAQQISGSASSSVGFYGLGSHRSIRSSNQPQPFSPPARPWIATVIQGPDLSLAYPDSPHSLCLNLLRRIYDRSVCTLAALPRSTTSLALLFFDKAPSLLLDNELVAKGTGEVPSELDAWPATVKGEDRRSDDPLRGGC